MSKKIKIEAIIKLYEKLLIDLKKGISINGEIIYNESFIDNLNLLKQMVKDDKKYDRY